MNRLLKRFAFNSVLTQNKSLSVCNRVNEKLVCRKHYCFDAKNVLSKTKLLPTIGTDFKLIKRLSTVKPAVDVKTISKKVSGEIESSQSLKTKKRSLRKKAVLEKSEQHLPILAFSTAEEYNLEDLVQALKEQGLYDVMPFSDEVDDALHLIARYQINQNKRELFIFREGSIVCWNMPFVECEAVLNFMKPYEHNSYDETIIEQEQEQMNFELVNTKSRLQKGLIHLNNKEEGIASDLEKYAFSNGIALSVKLSIWESLLDRYIDSIEFVSQDMKHGRNRLSRGQVFRKTGELFELKHHINLSSDLLDTPDFYWDRQELEKLFLDTIYFLNIKKRTNVMNEKLNHCIELMELLSTYLNDKHNATLEWMIIILIMVEVMFECIHYAERLI